MKKINILIIVIGVGVMVGAIIFSSPISNTATLSPELIVAVEQLNSGRESIRDISNDHSKLIVSEETELIQETEIIQETGKSDVTEEADVMPEVFEPVFKSEPLPQETINRIVGISWTEGAPVTLEDLRLVTVSYVDFNGEDCYGELVVNQGVAEDIVEIFQEIYEARFPIAKMVLIDAYGGDDNLSMADNNCSSFNYRSVPGTDRISMHSYGLAIDINPVQNPYLPGDEVMPPSGSAYIDRTDIRDGMIVEGDVVYHAFISRGWTWGGDWHSVKDYQHFVKALD